MVVAMSPIVGRWVGGLVQTEPCFAGEQGDMSRTRGFGTGQGAELADMAHIAVDRTYCYDVPASFGFGEVTLESCLYVHVVSTCDYKPIVWNTRHVCMHCVQRACACRRRPPSLHPVRRAE